MVIQNKELQNRLKKINDYQMLNIADLEDIIFEEEATITEEAKEIINDDTKCYTLKHIIYVSLILSSVFAVALFIGVIFFFRYLS